jgi:acetylornithine aminotransferase
MGQLLIKLLSQIDEVTEVRGRGLLLGVGLKDIAAKDVELECRKLGLLLNAVNEKTLRLAPALIVNIDQVKRSAEIIEDAIKNVKKGLIK